MKDRNGVKIKVGDIIKYTTDSQYKYLFKYNGVYIVEYEDLTIIKVKKVNTSDLELCFSEQKHIKIISNNMDNNKEPKFTKEELENSLKTYATFEDSGLVGKCSYRNWLKDQLPQPATLEEVRDTINKILNTHIYDNSPRHLKYDSLWNSIYKILEDKAFKL